MKVYVLVEVSSSGFRVVNVVIELEKAKKWEEEPCHAFLEFKIHKIL